MASKGGREKIKLESTAGTGHFYTTSKNKKTTPEKLEFLKFDPKARKHVLYKEVPGRVSGSKPHRHFLPETRPDARRRGFSSAPRAGRRKKMGSPQGALVGRERAPVSARCPAPRACHPCRCTASGRRS